MEEDLLPVHPGLSQTGALARHSVGSIEEFCQDETAEIRPVQVAPQQFLLVAGQRGQRSFFR